MPAWPARSELRVLQWDTRTNTARSTVSTTACQYREFKTDGFDFQLNWASPDQSWGRLARIGRTLSCAATARAMRSASSFRQREGREVGDGAIRACNRTCKWIGG